MVYPNPQIYHHLKTIFVHVPKTAGTAIEQALRENRRQVVGGHTTAQGYRSKFPEQFAQYWKFTVVRDPVERFVSAYRYLSQHPVHPALNNQVVHDCGSLESFVDRVGEQPGIIDKIVHLLPQHKFVCDPKGKVLVDSIFKFENLEEAWRDILRRTGLDDVPLPKQNVSRRISEVDFGSSLAKSLVSFIYAKDYEIFGYPLNGEIRH
jgi:hypothetical protein